MEGRTCYFSCFYFYVGFAKINVCIFPDVFVHHVTVMWPRSSSSPVLDEGLHQLRPEAGQAVAVTPREAEAAARCGNFLLSLSRQQEVQIRRESPQEVQNVRTSIAAKYPDCGDGRPELHRAAAVVQDSVRLDPQRLTAFIQNLQKPKTWWLPLSTWMWLKCEN